MGLTLNARQRLHEHACQMGEKKQEILFLKDSFYACFHILYKNYKNEILTILDYKNEIKRGIKQMLGFNILTTP